VLTVNHIMYFYTYPACRYHNFIIILFYVGIRTSHSSF